MAKMSIATGASANPTEAGDDVMDIEACIDDPVLAPLGRHVNKRKHHRRPDRDHIDIKVVHSSSPTTSVERESHVPVTSLILRRRRFDCAQLEDYLQNLQPTLDPLTMTTLQSPLHYLTELDLSRNRLSALPQKMTTLVPFLNYLNLSHNQFVEIPLELCRLTNLQVLIMSQNRIEGPVPHQLCSSLTQLKTLKLCANQITALPHTLARLDRLESLSMGSVYGGNLLTAFPPNCIQFMSALRDLDLSHNKLCFLPADIGHPNSHLRQLTVSDNKLEAIPRSIGLCQELRSLNLGRNQLTSLPTEISDLKQLDTLDLSENLLCVIPGDVADFLTKTTLLLTGNPFTRGYCDAGRNPVNEIGGLGVNYRSDEDRYAAILKSLSRRAILNSAASSAPGSGTHTPITGSFSGGRESPRLMAVGHSGYEMDQDERLDYHLYYTRHALSSRPPSRAESVSSMNDSSEYGGYWTDPYGPETGASTPRVNVEAVLADIDSFFDSLPTLTSEAKTTTTTTTVSSNISLAEPSIFEGTSLSTPPVPTTPAPTSTFTPTITPNMFSSEFVQETGGDSVIATPVLDAEVDKTPVASSLVDGGSTTIPTPNFFPSLRELVARTVLHTGLSVPVEAIPESVMDYLQPGARPCGHCRKPYIKEWVSSVRVKSYLGHPAVARRVRFCSVPCWKAANEQLDAEETGSTMQTTASPGGSTGHLPPMVNKSSDLEDDISMSALSSALPSPTGSMDQLDLLQQEPQHIQRMRVCKGGQTYWPVIIRQPRKRIPTSGVAEDAAAASQPDDTRSSIAKTNVCAKGCLGGGVCEW
ncbi:Podocan-like protein 1 [Mortierella sp. GBA43]|nr:Podocan-like protein 1 [Mortierella sp. GBA43]